MLTQTPSYKEVKVTAQFSATCIFVLRLTTKDVYITERSVQC